MSYHPLWFLDFVAYCIQVAALVGVGVIMAWLLRLRVPRVRLAYWHALLAICVLLPLLQPWRQEFLQTSGSVTGNVTFAASATAAPSGPSLADIVLLLICAGILLRTLWIALGLCRLWLYRRQAQPIEQVPQAVEEARRLVPVFPALFISCQLQIPATFGFIRPAILFPMRFLKMEPSMQKAIALHELLHVQRRDWLWNMFEELVLTLLWFHIPLWWVVRSARLSREQVVDAEAVRRSQARRPYLKALLEMAGQKRLAENLPAPLFLRESQLAERVALMMKEAHMSRKKLAVSISTAAVVLLTAGVTLVWAFPLKTSAPQAAAPDVSSAAASSESGAVAALPSGSHEETESRNGQTSVNDQIQKAGGKVRPPVPIYKQQPLYTHQAREKHVTGTVELLCTVDTKGNVTDVSEVSKPLGEGLDESAMNAVRNWKFKPATLNGEPVLVKISITINFKLPEKSRKASPKSTSANDPPAQSQQSKAEAAKDNRLSGKINQAEIQRQVEQARKQAEIARKAAAKIDQAKIQEQIDQALRQARIAQQVASKVNQAKIQQQIDEAMKQLKMAQITAPKIDEAKIQRQVDEAMKRARIAQEAAAKIDQAEIQKQVEEAMKQAKIAQKAAEKLNSAEMQQRLKQSLERAQAAQQQAQKEQEKAQKKMKEYKPPLPPPPSPEELKPTLPAPPSSQDLTPPPAPPQN